MSNLYRELGVCVPQKYPRKRRNIHSYVSAHDAQVLEKLYTWWKPSCGYDALAILLNSLEGDFAKRVAWTKMSYDCEQMAKWLMREVENGSK